MNTAAMVKVTVMADPEEEEGKSKSVVVI